MRPLRLVLGWIAVLAVAALMVSPAAALDTIARPRLQTGWTCVEVNGDSGLNVRSGAGTAYGVIATLAPDSRLEADFAQAANADGYQWVPVRFEGGEGWAITPRLALCPPTAATPAPTDFPAAPQAGVDADGTLDREEIALVARSVVLLANVQGDYIVATGTGTVTSADGLILTNAHVVEDADLVAVGILDDINDPPEYRYLAEVVGIDDETDAALVAIRADIDGDPVEVNSLNLPFIPVTLQANQVFRGDFVYIFGYPGIGDDYLVVTTGSIVSVENGSIGGERVPVWYRTDAEIAPGNSGGLVVNGNGEFIGVPTFVQTEDETGGRLGGIRPAVVALNSVMDSYTAATTAPQTGTQPVENVTFAFDGARLDHGAVVHGQPGIEFHVAFTLTGWQEQPATLYARFFQDDLSSAPLINAGAPGLYRDKNGQVMTSVAIVPCCTQTIYDDLPLFIPYSALGFTQPGSYPLKIQIAIAADDGSWQRTLSWEFISFTLR